MNAPVERSWLQRNAKWLVLGAITLGLLMLAAFVLAILFVVSTAMRSSDVYRIALERAQASPEVAAQLGTPVEPGFFTGGSIKIENSTGEADLNIPLSGPRGEATLNVVASKRAGVWHFERMHVQAADAAIDLLQPDASEPAQDEGQ